MARADYDNRNLARTALHGKPAASSLSPSPRLERRVSLANRLLMALWALPFLSLTARQLTGTLGPNPVEIITATTGLWALRLLWLSLLITPLCRLTGWQWLTRLRRAPALFSFFYACLHGLAYWLFEQELALRAAFFHILHHPHLLAGFLCLLTMTPLALTSTMGMMRRLGSHRWRRLHRLVYPAAMLAATHYLLLVKSDISAPGGYIVILVILFYARLTRTAKAHGAAALPGSPAR